jgi:hypothetical protein
VDAICSVPLRPPGTKRFVSTSCPTELPFGTEELRRGMNPVQLSNILGHGGMRMIERTYSNLSGDDADQEVAWMLAD